MKTFGDESEEFALLSLRCKGLVGTILKDIEPEKSGLEIKADRNIPTESEFQNKLLILRDGYLTYRRSHRRLFYFETGDLIGLEGAFLRAKAEISSTFPVTVDMYDSSAVFARIGANPDLMEAWSEYLVSFSSMMITAWTLAVQDKVYFAPDERVYAAGTQILQEGSAGSSVYLLDKGSCTVTVKGKKVGEIGEGELFGILAALSGSARTATVTAHEESRVFEMSKDNFIDLMRTRPTTVIKMVQSMARVINNLNRQVVALQPNDEEGLRGG